MEGKKCKGRDKGKGEEVAHRGLELRNGRIQREKEHIRRKREVLLGDSKEGEVKKVAREKNR